MASEKRFLTYNLLALLCATWFYYFNVVFVFPFAIIGFFLWRNGRGAEKKLLNKITGWMLLAGLVSSIGYLIVVSLNN